MCRLLILCCLGTAALALAIAQNAPSPNPPAPNAPNAQTPPTPRPLETTANAKAANQIDPSAVQRGQRTFQANCAFCHGSNGKGGESGPDLLRSQLVIDDEHGSKIGPVVHNGRPDKGMPRFQLSDDQINDISAFLHDRIHAAAERDNYQILNIVVGDAKQGEAYFNGAGHCAQCHSVTGDLAHIGSGLDPVNIQQRIVMPREGRSAGAKEEITAEITLPSGAVVTGALRHIDDFTISVISKDGDYRSFPRDGEVPKVVLHDPLQAHIDMLMKYTDADIHNLTAYLVNLK